MQKRYYELIKKDLNYEIHSAMLSPGVYWFVQTQRGKKIHLFPPGLNAKQALLKGGEACNPNW